MLFKDLDIIQPILKAVGEAGYEKSTPIQAKAIPPILEGRDVLGCAQTGTGKTAAFSIPVLQNIVKGNKEQGARRTIKALIVAPTRELAIQIGENFTTYSKHLNIKNTVIFGGVNQGSQVRKLTAGVDVLIATPGRLLDLQNQGYVDLKNVKYFILDEADRMLDMGMIHDVKRIITKLPKERQNLLFSATMPREITNLVNSILKNKVKVEIEAVSSTVEVISQGAYMVPKKEKKPMLAHLLKDETIKSVIVFSRTKHGANKITKDLINVGIAAAAIHGNKSQNQRQLALNNFKEGKLRVLVATDIAARGIDVDELSHVINYDLPDVPETYVHRIGRTGRAGRDGVAITLCDPEELDMFRKIERLIGKSIPVLGEQKFEIKEVEVASNSIRKTDEPKNSGHKNSKRKYDGKGKSNGQGNGRGKGKSSEQGNRGRNGNSNEQGNESRKWKTNDQGNRTRKHNKGKECRINNTK